MPYQFVKETRDYSDYASGRVFYAAPGHPAFPVRLISEVFQRCQAIRQKMGLSNPVTLYDPCCGSTYHLSTLAYLHWHEIDTIIGSDIEANILPIAIRNLNLLTQSGLEKRADEIRLMYKQYGKPSHAAALKSVQQFGSQLGKYLSTHQIKTRLFQADATDARTIMRELKGSEIDIILADIPYGKQSNWQSFNEETNANKDFLWHMLNALLIIITNNTVVAIVTNKAQKCNHSQYKRVDQFQIGKRRITLLQLT